MQRSQNLNNPFAAQKRKKVTDIESTARQIVHAAIKVHKALGPGLLESVYQKCLTYELEKTGLKVQCEVPLPVQYEDIKIDAGFRADMIIEDSVIIENKTVDQLAPIHEAQLLTYLKITGMNLGFLLNWKVTLMKDGIKRMVNELEE
jgi:GxxExxY protein